jgi:hypothetical protein
MYTLKRFCIHLYIRCTCVCKSCPIYTFDVHVYAKAIQFIHSMYMRMRKLFNSHVHQMYKLNSFRIHMYIEWINWIAFAYACTSNVYQLNKFCIRIYIECINWIGFRCTCVCESYSIYTFDVHVYAKAIQFIHSMYMCMRKLFNSYIRHRMIKLNSFRIHMYIECINWIAFACACTSNV